MLVQAPFSTIAAGDMTVSRFSFHIVLDSVHVRVTPNISKDERVTQ